MTRRTDPRTTRAPLAAVLAEGGTLPDFTPVPRRYVRHDGWTAARQRAFIEALADTGSVGAACKAVNMSQGGAYQLRRQKGAASFRAAWDAALDCGVRRLEDVAMERALNGVEEPFYVYGNHVGTRTRYNDRLLMFLLRNRAPERFGASVNGASLRGLNAVGKMEKRRLKKKWRKQWEAERRSQEAAQRRNVSVAEVRASIDRKVEEVRREVEAERAREWERFSPETREAWDRFVALRDADRERIAAEDAERKVAEKRPSETVNVEPYDWRRKPLPPPPRKTVHRLTDDGWDETE
ncbi:MAG: hypothetical protein V2I43_14205 [Parvularcula sp.]|jgi:hypothetical protein|nr:hypothetical protein [Parvularcula sp.]